MKKGFRWYLFQITPDSAYQVVRSGKVIGRMRIKGYLLAALAAATYGTNPAFAVPLYEQGMNPTSVLLFRYVLSLPMIALMMLYRGRSFRIKSGELLPMGVLGILMALSSLGLYESYRYMNSGVASTLLFIYPVLVAVMMSMFFHERFRITTGLCLVIMAAGLMLLVHTEAGFTLSAMGCLMVFLSSLTYAIYLVMTNVWNRIKGISTLKLLFYQLLIGSSVFFVALACGEPLTLPTRATGWINLSALAFLPTFVSLGCTTMAIHLIGSTPTAIFGALEPVTAVVLSVVVLGQTLTIREIFGGLLIVLATSMVVASSPIDRMLLRMRKMLPRIHRR